MFNHPNSPMRPRDENWIRIDGRSLPPALFRPELENSKVQVRSVCGRVAGGSYVSDNVTLLYCRTLANAFGVPIEVSVVVRIPLGGVELINGIAAGLAQKQFLDHA